MKQKNYSHLPRGKNHDNIYLSDHNCTLLNNSVLRATPMIDILIIQEIISIVELDKRVERINSLKALLHSLSPFKNEPVDCVLWVKEDNVFANDYNPNSVAPPEMELLRHSINHDGYTQPVVTWVEESGRREVIDGFHRTRVCKEFPDVRDRVFGYLPVVNVKSENTERSDRIASTIRHNRARGKHKVDSMSEIVIELKRRNWSAKKIGKELGMDQDEVLRLCQISGLTELFSDESFSKSWDIDFMSEDDIDFVLNEENIEPDKEAKETRILHTYDNWECYKAGFYETHPPKGMTKESCEISYATFLCDIPLFEKTLEKVISEWKYSCEHYLTNDSMNRVAWLGQASLCYYHKIPSYFRNGYNLLSERQKKQADETALKYLNIWLSKNNFPIVTEIEKVRMDIY